MEIRLRKLLIFLLMLLSTTTSGCCSRVESDPPRPNQVRGWREFEESGIKAIGEFVLKKGETVDNGSFGVKLIDTIPDQNCFITEGPSHLPKATMQFYRVSDKQVLLEIDLPKANTSFMSFRPSIVEEYSINTISIREINTKEGWIWFELWK